MKKYILKHANLFDGNKDSKLIKDIDIEISDNRITKIGKNIPNKDKVKEIDCSNKYITPGLINLHVHLPANGKAPFKNSNAKKLVKLIVDHKILHKVGIGLGKKYALVSLKSGVTSLRAVGGVADFDSKLRDLINNGKVTGPRLFVANNAIATENGHMVGTVSVAVSNIEEAKKKIESLKKEGVDIIKIMITGGVLDAKKRGEPGVLRMKPELVKAICDEAHKNGFQVAAHVESFEGLKIAIINGVDSIEHGSYLDDEAVKLFKEHKAAFVETLSPAIPLAILSEEESGCNDDVQYNTYVILKNFIEGVKRAIKEDIPVGLGTDTGSPFVTHYNFYREFVWFKHIFKTSSEYAIYCATLGNAKILKQDKNIGSIEVGKYADMIIMNENPIESLKAFGNINTVIKDGVIYKNLKVKKNHYLDEKLDKLMDIDVEQALKDKFEK